MQDRIAQELALLRRSYPETEYRPDGQWVRIPGYRVLSDLWKDKTVTVAFQIPTGYPGQAPYAFYVQPPPRLKDSDQRPTNNYEEPASGIPFDGAWGKFSWQQDGWRATADLASGSNLLNFVRTFKDRFQEGA